ncbi:hypothetical protein KC360_g901 [Hortaea werneckii]|nr:hypothetical protein KC325_g1241 [Hortaea werneckii]KAI6999735.1 hypothetical protein KC359_g1631 [Hortaea werneckii]KAI7149708.1 hypothetical protein KC344_g794 [Hortaea werneckii]KAI7179427.1 hypothetical protein KC360_g901 [Hortaea werneckii]
MDLDNQPDPSALEATEATEPDEARPAKRVRLDGALDVTEEVQEEIVDDKGWDDIYGKSKTVDTEPTSGEQRAVVPSDAEQPSMDEPDVLNPTREIAEPPSIGLVPQSIPNEQKDQQEVEVESKKEQHKENELPEGVPPEAVADENADLVPEAREPNAADEPSVRMLQETSGVNGDPNANLQIEAAAGQTTSTGEIVQPVENAASIQRQQDEALQGDNGETGQVIDGGGQQQQTAGAEDASAGLLSLLEAKPEPTKPTEDAEFMAAAAAQKGEGDAEWQFDSSDAESSDSSDSDSSSDSSSDASSEENYEMMDPATVAKILMSGEGDDDGGNKKGGSGADSQPRTTNEVKEEVVPKPDVTITQTTKITELGTVEHSVDNMILIKGAAPPNQDYNVLEPGSVLCNEKREVIGAVSDTIGKVQEPMYSVSFTNAKEIEDLGLQFGAKVFYVDEHSQTTFTQPLRNMKFTDASNIHDEEVAEDEMEFSDDEKEAAYKKAKTLAKKEKAAARGGGGGLNNRSSPPPYDTRYPSISNPNQVPYGAGLSYDDGDEEEEHYNPLRRPDNLSELMAAGGPPPAMRGGFPRGARGGGRARGDRGRGRGDRGGRGRGGGFNQDRGGGQRGGRGGYRGDFQQNAQRGNAHAYPHGHNGPAQQHFQPPGGNQPPVAQYQQPQQQAGHPAYGAYPNPGQQNQQQQQPGTYQFNGYTFQYGNAPPAQAPTPQQQWYNQQAVQHGNNQQQQGNQQQQQQQQQQPAAGAYYNYNYYQQQQPMQGQYGAYTGWPPGWQQGYPPAGAPQQQSSTGPTQQQSATGTAATQQQPSTGTAPMQQQQQYPAGTAPTPEQQQYLQYILQTMGGGAGGAGQ